MKKEQIEVVIKELTATYIMQVHHNYEKDAEYTKKEILYWENRIKAKEYYE